MYDTQFYALGSPIMWINTTVGQARQGTIGQEQCPLNLQQSYYHIGIWWFTVVFSLTTKERMKTT